jgi:hypothetical protein
VEVEFSYGFDTLKVVENHPVSFSGFTIGRPSQARWLGHGEPLQLRWPESIESGRPVFWGGKATGTLSHDCSADGDSRWDFSALANAEHLGAASWADTLCGRLTVLHGDGFSAFHFFLCPAFHTISLHVDLLNLYSQSRIADMG